MPSEQINVATRREWRELGFFYDRDDGQKRWRIVGTRSGLERFCDELATFAGNSKNDPESEHVHLGPYMYLELGSWPTPQITDHWIAGPLSMLRSLADGIRLKLASAGVGTVMSFRDVFAPESAYDLILSYAATSLIRRRKTRRVGSTVVPAGEEALAADRGTVSHTARACLVIAGFAPRWSAQRAAAELRRRADRQNHISRCR